MRALCTDQFRVIQSDESGLATGKTCLSTGKCSHDDAISCTDANDCVINPWYCRFSNIDEYSDTGKSDKLCGSKYLEDASYVLSDNNDANKGFSTFDHPGSVITQLYQNVADLPERKVVILKLVNHHIKNVKQPVDVIHKYGAKVYLYSKKKN